MTRSAGSAQSQTIFSRFFTPESVGGTIPLLRPDGLPCSGRLAGAAAGLPPPARPQNIYAGTTEIMKELLSRTL